MIIALPAVVGLFLLADVILILFYQDADFLVSAGVLRIIVWTLLAEVLTSILGQALWASSRERLSLRISVINTLVQCVSSIVLISAFGVMGAAASVLLTSAFNLIQHLIPTAESFSVAGLASAMTKPAVATTVMAAFVVYGRDFQLAAIIGYAVVLYFLVLTGLFIWSAGGLSQFRAACVNLWTT